MISLEPENLGNAIRAYREAAHLSQANMAHRLGVAVSTLSLWERGKSFPRPRDLKELQKLMSSQLDVEAQYSSGEIQPANGSDRVCHDVRPSNVPKNEGFSETVGGEPMDWTKEEAPEEVVAAEVKMLSEVAHYAVSRCIANCAGKPARIRRVVEILLSKLPFGNWSPAWDEGVLPEDIEDLNPYARQVWEMFNLLIRRHLPSAEDQGSESTLNDEKIGAREGERLFLEAKQIVDRKIAQEAIERSQTHGPRRRKSGEHSSSEKALSKAG